MGDSESFCFVMMPFTAELNYFFLYLRDHVKRTHNVRCERADATILTIPILDKINGLIRSADVIIADCSGRNPNVFYELGIAHALEKQVILITSDEISQAPSDIRHFEFIRYTLSDHVAFFDRLDNALRNVFVERYEQLYSDACRVFDEFSASFHASVARSPREVFVKRIRDAEALNPVPSTAEVYKFTEYVLPKVILDASDMDVMRRITTYVSAIGSASNDPDS